jgi:pilus assembly protein CpaB
MAIRRLRPWIILVLALLCGFVAAVLAVRYLRQQTTPLMAESPRGRVAVASRDLGVGTVLTQADVKVVDWPASTLPSGYLATTAGAVGRGLMRQVQENEPFLESKLAPKGAGGGLQVSITEGMRAMSVRVDEVVGVAGFVLPDTRVDVLLTLEKAGSAQEPATEVLLQNVRTLAAGQEVQQDKDGKPKTVPVITLLVTPEQAETLALAANQGRVQLALRNTLDTLNVSTRGAKLGGLFGAPPSPSSGARRGPVIRYMPQPTRDSTVVEVYKGGARTLLKF